MADYWWWIAAAAALAAWGAGGVVLSPPPPSPPPDCDDIRDLWITDHIKAIEKHGEAGVIEKFRQLNIDVSFLEETVTAYRGTFNIEYAEARRGLSWTLNRDVACFFACGLNGPNPLVLRATVRRRDIVFYSNDRSEREIIPARVSVIEIDGSPAEWRDRCGRFMSSQPYLARKWPSAH